MIELLQPIIDRLVEVFGEEIPIYKDKQEQGVKTPCFFVRIIQTELVGQFDNMYWLNNLVSITYMNDTDDMYKLEKVRFAMLTELEQVNTSNGVMGRNLQTKVQGTDIVFTANYNLRIEREKIPDPVMERLKQEGRIKDGDS